MTSRLEQFFSGWTEFVFQTELGLADPPLTDYLSRLLLRFTRTDSLYWMSEKSERLSCEVAQMARYASSREGSERRAIHRRIGDLTLFWSGVCPQGLQRENALMANHRQVRQIGKSAYRIASMLRAEQEEQEAPGEVLERLSELFEVCAEGLREVQRQWRSEAAGEELLTP